MRPMPVLGQVDGSNSPPGSTFTVEPWHWKQPTATAGAPPTTSPRKLSREALPCLCVVTALLLIDFSLVAASTVLRRDNDGNCCAVMFEGTGICFIGTVTLIAAHSLCRMGALAPFRG